MSAIESSSTLGVKSFNWKIQPHVTLSNPDFSPVRSTMASKKDAVSAAELDQEFQEILQSIDKLELSDVEIYKTLAPLRWHMFRCRWFKRIKIIAVLAAFAFAVYYIPLLNWNASAIGRLAMIQVLPYWDWKPLYKERCLVKDVFRTKPYQKSSTYIYADECTVCENVDSITRLENVSYNYLYEHHLLRSLPVVISDSHKIWVDRPWKNVTSFLEAIEPLILAKPCNLQSNLIFTHPLSSEKRDTIATLFEILTSVQRNDSWFLQFRNCELKTVKRTRLLIEKPYYYAPHLEMPYTNWFLLSNNYPVKSPKRLKLEGLVIVMQLKESITIRLRAKGECDRICSDMVVNLREGESLLFETNLWQMEYLPSAAEETAITFITETFHE